MLVDGPLGLLHLAVRHQPARALRDVPAQVDDHQAHHRTDQEAEPPAPVIGSDVSSSKTRFADGADQRAGPIGAVDRDVDPAAVLGRDQLVDRRVDRGVLTADAHPGHEPEEPGAREFQDRPARPSRPDRRQGDDEQLRRPHLSVSRPKTSAPTTSPPR